MTTSLREAIAKTATSIEELLAGRQPVCGLILGSGLNFYADTLEQQEILPYKQLPHMKVSTATGHKGRFVLGRVPGTEVWVLCMQGRLHGYEGVIDKMSRCRFGRCKLPASIRSLPPMRSVL